MKKLVFMFAAFVALSFTSCGNKCSCNGIQNDSTTVDSTMDSTVVDSDSVVSPN